MADIHDRINAFRAANGIGEQSLAAGIETARENAKDGIEKARSSIHDRINAFRAANGADETQTADQGGSIFEGILPPRGGFQPHDIPDLSKVGVGRAFRQKLVDNVLQAPTIATDALVTAPAAFGQTVEQSVTGDDQRKGESFFGRFGRNFRTGQERGIVRKTVADLNDFLLRGGGLFSEPIDSQVVDAAGQTFIDFGLQSTGTKGIGETFNENLAEVFNTSLEMEQEKADAVFLGRTLADALSVVAIRSPYAQQNVAKNILMREGRNLKGVDLDHLARVRRGKADDVIDLDAEDVTGPLALPKPGKQNVARQLDNELTVPDAKTAKPPVRPDDTFETLAKRRRENLGIDEDSLDAIVYGGLVDKIKRAFPNGVKRMKESGIEAGLLGILADADPVQSALIGAGAQAAGSGALFTGSHILKNNLVNNAFGAALILGIAQTLTPMTDNKTFLQNLETIIDKESGFLAAGALSSLLWRRPGVAGRFADRNPVVADSVMTFSRSTVASMAAKLVAANEAGDEAPMQVLAILRDDPEAFGPQVGSRLFKTMDIDKGDGFFKQVDRLYENRTFRRRFNQILAEKQKTALANERERQRELRALQGQ